MSISNPTIIINFLIRNGITDEKEQREILNGFDMEKPIYENDIFPNEQLYQFVRNVNANDPFINTGRWFCLKGATMDSLAIFSGGAGRSLTEFKAIYQITALEGTAKKMERNWNWAGGGTGGMTQIFIPKSLLYALEYVGTH